MLSGARIATLVAFFAIAAIVSFAAMDRWRAGSPSATLVPDGPESNNRFVVTEAPPQSMLHRGDRVEIDDRRAVATWQFHSLAVGSVLNVRRMSPGTPQILGDPIVPSRAPHYASIVVVIQAMFLAIAALIATRGRSSGSLSLAWLFALLVLLFNPTTPAWPDWLVLVYDVLGAPLAIAAFLCATDFASRFAGDPDARWARRIRRIAFIAGGIAIVANLGLAVQMLSSPTTPLAAQYASSASILAEVLFFLAALWFAFAKAPVEERQRVRWVASALAVGIVGLVAEIIGSAVGISEPARDLPLILLVAMPIGCAYAILRYRLLDIAFVVNRATVFGITSLLVLSALAIVDYGLTKLLGSWLVDHGTSVQLAVALVIGIATRPLHARVDTIVDDVFFRQRHDTERALRRFANDVAFIDDANAVYRRTVQTVSVAAGLSCTLFVTVQREIAVAASSDERHPPPAVDHNDAALVRLRATREPVDLHELDTSLAGDFGFPMFARNRLVGVLICAGKSNGAAAYAPDELDAIGAVARAAGLALDLLRIENLERELERFRYRSHDQSASTDPSR